jgi:predicted O-linked N-acetylglucosamine transferase (SPINDLY family)
VRPRAGRKLRIGYLWSMLGSLTDVPFIAHHDRSRYALYAYSDGPADRQAPENVARFDGYRSIVGLGDAEAARIIAADEIDILVDLGGQGWAQRSGIAEYRPAPIQIGYSNKTFTTGSDRMDWLIGNPGTYLPDLHDHFRERIYELPRMFVQVAWSGKRSPVVPPPYLVSGRITIGTSASLFKVNRGTLDFWCGVLARLPDARLRLAFGPQPPGASDRLRSHFGAHGVPASRYELVEGRNLDFFDYLNTLDLALDAFPHSSNFTAYQAVSQGVPLVTLAGDRYQGRLAAGLLRAIGRSEWIGRDVANAIDIACALANDRPRLAHERVELPGLVERAGVVDFVAYARAMEEAYEMIFAD